MYRLPQIISNKLYIFLDLHLSYLLTCLRYERKREIKMYTVDHLPENINRLGIKIVQIDVGCSKDKINTY